MSHSSLKMRPCGRAREKVRPSPRYFAPFGEGVYVLANIEALADMEEPL